MTNQTTKPTIGTTTTEKKKDWFTGLEKLGEISSYENAVEEAYHKGFYEGLNTRNKSCDKCKHCRGELIVKLRNSGMSYGEIKKLLGIKWTNSVVTAIKTYEE